MQRTPKALIQSAKALEKAFQVLSSEFSALLAALQDPKLAEQCMALANQEDKEGVQILFQKTVKKSNVTVEQIVANNMLIRGKVCRGNVCVTFEIRVDAAR